MCLLFIKRNRTKMDVFTIHQAELNQKKQNSTCNRTRAGLNGISTCFGEVFSQSMIFSTSALVTWKLSQLRIADSRRILMEYGSLSELHINRKLISVKGHARLIVIKLQIILIKLQILQIKISQLRI